jgi:hypothetical protein
LGPALESVEIAPRDPPGTTFVEPIPRAMVSEPTVDRLRPDTYDQCVETITRIATRIDAVLTKVVAIVLRAVAAVLALVLRRGRYREWRRRGAEARRRTSSS